MFDTPYDPWRTRSAPVLFPRLRVEPLIRYDRKLDWWRLFKYASATLILVLLVANICAGAI